MGINQITAMTIIIASVTASLLFSILFTSLIFLFFTITLHSYSARQLEGGHKLACENFFTGYFRSTSP